MAIDWSDIQSRKVRDAFRVALADKQLSHAEVVEVLRKVLEDGNLSGVEVNDLQKIAKTSETMPPRSKQMLMNLGYEVYQILPYGPIDFSTSRQKYAVEILCDFIERIGPQRFPKLDRDRVGIDLLLRVANPNIINQGNAGLCGPVSFLSSLAFLTHRPHMRNSGSTYLKRAKPRSVGSKSSLVLIAVIISRRHR